MAASKKSKKKAKKKTAKKTVSKAKARTAKARIAKTSAKTRVAKTKTAARGKSTRAKSKPAGSKVAKSKPTRSARVNTTVVRSDPTTRAGAVAVEPTEDFQGLSRTEQADSESIDELVEEGNVFEAGAVAGVQRADDEDEREVHTREFPEDDVPEEYLDKDE